MKKQARQNKGIAGVASETTPTIPQTETGHYKFAQEFIVKGKSHEEIMAFIRSIGDPQAAADLPALCMVKPVLTENIITTPATEQIAT